jgi:hypothetical protein
VASLLEDNIWWIGGHLNQIDLLNLQCGLAQVAAALGVSQPVRDLPDHPAPEAGKGFFCHPHIRCLCLWSMCYLLYESFS